MVQALEFVARMTKELCKFSHSSNSAVGKGTNFFSVACVRARRFALLTNMATWRGASINDGNQIPFAAT